MTQRAVQRVNFAQRVTITTLQATLYKRPRSCSTTTQRFAEISELYHTPHHTLYEHLHFGAVCIAMY